jgi:cellulose synthase/poly-beta-1,6-N-acetylglucosamine synthase-like glycosyltransferase
MNGNQLTIMLLVALLTYTWAGYLAVLLILQRLFPNPIARSPIHPRVSIILAVHNEEKCIEEKLLDCLRLKYPSDGIEILVASDCSTDATEQIVEQFALRHQSSGGLQVEPAPVVRLLRCETRAGKSGAQNLAAQQASGEILFFSDANTRMDPCSLERMVENFGDARVGLVTAAVHFLQPKGAVPEGQGMYWRYELLMRQAESDIGILSKASGQAIAMRRELFRPLTTCYGDDCVMPLGVRLSGYRVVLDRRAIVTDTMPHTPRAEMKARIRMTSRNWGGTFSQTSIFNPFRFPVTSWGLASHKVLRWLSPFFLMALFGASTISASRHEWVALWLGQVAFYVAAFLGWHSVRRGKGAGMFGYAFAFCLANVGFLFGLVRALRNQRIAAY